MNYRDMPVELLNWPGNKWEDIWKVLIGFKRFKQECPLTAVAILFTIT